MKKNQQPIEKRSRTDGLKLYVHSIFYTIQGEGPFCGQPAVFIRLAGCNLQCPWCDTDYTSSRALLTPNQIIADTLVEPWSSNTEIKPLVVITGGEPFRQNLGPLLKLLYELGYRVQIETNGTLPPPQADGFQYHTQVGPWQGVYLVCSPKTGKVHPDITARACCYKYVTSVEDGASLDGLPLQALGHSAHPMLARPPAWWDRPIYLQPADHKDEEINRANQEIAVKSCMKHGYTIQLQIHKYLNLE
jgi:organic radical activating enzyme